MIELILSPPMIERIEELYSEMEAAYDDVARQLQFGCQGCPDNCCDSYFLHHTYLEWSYLWLGMGQLSEEKQKNVLDRAHHYVVETERALQQNVRPQIMCPLNEKGLCLVYSHRLMVCRTHGVPAQLVRPDGQKLHFPGCFRCQELVGPGENSPEVDRTAMLVRLARMENDLLNNKRHLYPKVRLTIAEMLVKGPPSLPAPFCQR